MPLLRSLVLHKRDVFYKPAAPNGASSDTGYDRGKDLIFVEKASLLFMTYGSQ